MIANHVPTYPYTFIILYDYIYAEISKALTSVPILPAERTTFTTSRMSSTVSTTTVSQEFTRSTTAHHTSSVLSLNPTTTSVTSTTQLQGLLIALIYVRIPVNITC